MCLESGYFRGALYAGDLAVPFSFSLVSSVASVVACSASSTRLIVVRILLYMASELLGVRGVFRCCSLQCWVFHSVVPTVILGHVAAPARIRILFGKFQ